MNNIIHAAHRFGDAAAMASIEFHIWCHARYWIGLTYDEALRYKNTWGDVERLERLYEKWLINRGEEVADRR